MMTTREARIRTIELIYESEFYDAKDLDSALARANIREDKVNSFVKKCYNFYFENADEIDSVISQSSNDWKLYRISNVNKAVIRLCTVELMYTDVPPKVAINEAVEISKMYDDGKSISFVNGVLNKIARDKGKIVDER